MDRILDIPAAYGEALLEAGERNENIVVLDADLQDSCQTEAFYARFPGRAFDLGVAEQSLPTFAAGLALCGKIPFYNTFAVFGVCRAFDQLRVSVAYNRANVKIVGHASGLSLGYAGPSHHALEDVALMRALPNMVVLCPANDLETRQMVQWMADYHGQVYLRLIRAKGPRALPDRYQFEPGKTVQVCDGHDVTVFTTGDLLAVGLSVREELASEGISVQVVHVPTLKPLPPEEIIQWTAQTQAAVNVEDHNVIGGLGDAVAKIFAEHLQRPLKTIGIGDQFTESDDREVLLGAYGVSTQVVADTIRGLVQRG